MRKGLLLAAALLLVVPATGCRTRPIYQVEAVPLVPPVTMSDAELEEAIRRAGAREGWVIEPVEPGELEGRIQVRGKHWAVVRIRYDRVALSIRYKDSGNLLYDGKRIHRNYNKWVARLAKEITEAVNRDARTGS
jgi:hypothetical protein